ncbi:tRNA threonylcarbamoyladenosine biosynthesis protein TsaB [Treponema bryantii]|uniref:tRNA threonylcarbamoyladenosine biosynthesis protein TsaB n=1 Tax=Treponema bryantii TaxID=163 RepID=A0A1H9IBC3_9SPIR|nr:tRNA (adenosine(37)-N6)-threonylcarbamoyltransferase complex dimerization subunit type 1 TsaB [Treponema bryantii]SEQ71869.1 tRNA threonylcarbamoyladenosine biosynthesis protein TsaB [Treponema bryantii]
MNILALDCAVTRISLAVKTDSKFISATYDIGMRQSEILVPSIDELLKKAELKPSELNATALTIGPGSFTGLRLGISALKAIELAYNVPVYGISSLEAYAYPYKNLGFTVLSCIDANKDKFYARLSDGSNNLLKDDDYEIEKITEAVKDLDTVFVCGPDAKKLSEKLQTVFADIKFLMPEVPAQTAEALILMTEELIEKKAEPLKDFDGPVYLRASEAELKLNGTIS